MKVLVLVIAAFCISIWSMPIVQAYPQAPDTTTSTSASTTPAEHQATAERYAEEAAQLRAKSEQHARTAKMHATHRGPRDVAQKLQHHCERLAADYATAAKEAEELASLHRELAAAGK